MFLQKKQIQFFFNKLRKREETVFFVLLLFSSLKTILQVNGDGGQQAPPPPLPPPFLFFFVILRDLIFIRQVLSLSPYVCTYAHTHTPSYTPILFVFPCVHTFWSDHPITAAYRFHFNRSFQFIVILLINFI